MLLTRELWEKLAQLGYNILSLGCAGLQCNAILLRRQKSRHQVHLPFVIEEVAPGCNRNRKCDGVYGLNNWFIDGAAVEYCITTLVEIR